METPTEAKINYRKLYDELRNIDPEIINRTQVQDMGTNGGAGHPSFLVWGVNKEEIIALYRTLSEMRHGKG